jgi:hypothetical protein
MRPGNTWPFVTLAWCLKFVMCQRCVSWRMSLVYVFCVCDSIPHSGVTSMLLWGTCTFLFPFLQPSCNSVQYLRNCRAVSTGVDPFLTPTSSAGEATVRPHWHCCPPTSCFWPRWWLWSALSWFRFAFLCDWGHKCLFMCLLWLLWRNVYLGPLPFLILNCLFIVDVQGLFRYSRQKSLISIRFVTSMGSSVGGLS